MVTLDKLLQIDLGKTKHDELRVKEIWPLKNRSGFI